MERILSSTEQSKRSKPQKAERVKETHYTLTYAGYTFPVPSPEDFQHPIASTHLARENHKNAHQPTPSSTITFAFSNAPISLTGSSPYWRSPISELREEVCCTSGPFFPPRSPRKKQWARQTHGGRIVEGGGPRDLRPLRHDLAGLMMRSRAVWDRNAQMNHWAVLLIQKKKKKKQGPRRILSFCGTGGGGKNGGVSDVGRVWICLTGKNDWIVLK